jgi:phage-related protein
MRPSGAGNDGRALYVTAKGRRMIIVAAFIKKTNKTPARMIALGLERAKGVLE